MRSDPSRALRAFARSSARRPGRALCRDGATTPTRRRRARIGSRDVGRGAAGVEGLVLESRLVDGIGVVRVYPFNRTIGRLVRSRPLARGGRARARGTPRDDDETTIRRRDDARHSDARRRRRRRRRRVASVVDARASSTRERDARAVDAMALDRALATRARASGASTSTSTRDASGRRPGPGARGRPAKGRGRGKVRGDRRDATRARRASIGTGRDVRGAVFARWGGTATSKTASDARERRECDSMES